MFKPIDSDTAFLSSLTKVQRDYFLARESSRQVRLQNVVLHLSRGLSEVSGLHGDAQGLVLHEMSIKP